MSERKPDSPSSSLASGSSPVGREPPAGNSAAESDRLPRHRENGVNSTSGDEPQPKLGFMQAIKAARRNRPGHARTKSQRRDPKRKAHSLIDKVYRRENLWTAWRRVRRNKGAHGLDRVTIRSFEADVDTHLREIQRKLMERRYVPTPVRRVYIEKSSDPKKRRPLGIPVVADRIVQQAIFQIVDPLFDPEMSDRSFGFRKGRNAHQAMAALIGDAKEGFRWVVDADIFSFFDQIDHDVAMSCIRERIADGRVLALLEAFLKAGVSEDGTVSVPERGTPQGGVISPWIANLVLDNLDKAIEAGGWRHVRYADDFVVLCRSQEEAETALILVKEVLGKLKLKLHPEKTSLTDFRVGFEFLGFRFRSNCLGIRAKSIEQFKDKVRMLTRRQQGRNVDAVLADLNPVLRGWARYVGAAEAAAELGRLDQWVRMRMRAFRTKRKCHNDNWRFPNRRLAKWGLLSLLDCRPALRLSLVRARTQ
jgi:RNA-directed DNA polymerase